MTRTELEIELDKKFKIQDEKLDMKFALILEKFNTQEANFKTQEAKNDVWRAEFSKKLDVGMDNIEKKLDISITNIDKKLDVNLVATKLWFWGTACFFVATIIYVTYDIFTTITSITSSFTP